MTLYKPTFESVQYVAANMRQADREEILPLQFDPSPEALARVVMSDTRYCWLAAKDVPIAAFGMFEVRPRSWTAFAFGTDRFSEVARDVTKFLVRKVRPHLFGELGAVRVEAHSHPEHRQAHAWLRRLGAKPTMDPEFGPNGEPYLHFVMRRSDWELSQAKNPDRIVFSGGASPLDAGGKPDFASPAGI